MLADILASNGLEPTTDLSQLSAEDFALGETRMAISMVLGGETPDDVRAMLSPQLVAQLVRKVDPDAKIAERFHLSDLGNAGRFASGQADSTRYVCEWGWLAWDGRRWDRDTTGQAEQAARDTVRGVYGEAAACPNQTERRGIAKWALSTESAQRIRAMLALAESETGIRARAGDFDRDPWRLNVLNGTLDLRTGKLRPHMRQDNITKLAAVEHDPHATCPLWLKFLAETTDGDQNMIAYLQRMVGLALTGDTSEHCFHLLWGTGANGKTTFTSIILALLGEYGQTTSIDTLLAKRAGGIPNDLAALCGSRLVVASEIPENGRLNESLVKDLTGQDRISARFLHHEWFEFVPSFKLWLFGNHRPVIRGTDYAIWRRVRLVPFTVTIPEARQDKHLADKLKAELPGILNWALEGCLAWQRDGLQPTEKVKAATTGYRLEQDVLGQFLAECTIESDLLEARASELYKAYTEWCQENGEKAVSGTAFGRAMTERGYDKHKSTYVNYRGVGLAVEPDSSDSSDTYLT